MIVKGNIVDVKNREIFAGKIVVKKGKIIDLQKAKTTQKNYIIPGFIDAHIHIESSMLVPSEFAKIAVCHGTVATVSDPHEIANVLGVKGVEFMINNGKQVPLKFNFGAPSCVPATTFETAGASINANHIKKMMQNPDIKYLAEMMNYPGVLSHNTEVIKKITHAKQTNKPIDGHAPGLVGKDLTTYINAGISTDHESITFNEALEKLQKGMKILIREGSAAKNFEALISLLPEHFDNMMFCSDDKHPDDLLLGHINQLCARAVAQNIDVFKVLQAACVNPVHHYNLEVGLLQKGDNADFVVVNNLKDFKVLETYINGEIVAKNGESLIDSVPFTTPNNFNTQYKKADDFQYKTSSKYIKVIKALDGELVTHQIFAKSFVKNKNLISNTTNDILKITVVNRYKNATPTVAFVKNFNLKQGAIASSVAHDSHNIIAVGVTDELICKAVNLLIKNKGGICAVTNHEEKIIPLPIAGIMSNKPATVVGKAYADLDAMAKNLGSKLQAPFMTLSFMALLVIPSLKLSDKGLFDCAKFELTPLEHVPV